MCRKVCAVGKKGSLVTCGQIPSWIDTKNKKLNIVFHKDFIPEEYLPTFNSMP
ncbi:hypothetical protein [Citrobacter freundii]|uniref:hypothetical protein n=1 Tax=Citrobacter freundii TaxID=546 RepID=UPI00388D8C32